MTEAEWLTCTDPQPMLEFLRGKASDRKLRLLTCACCRRIWQLMKDERSRKAVEVLERSPECPENDNEWQSAGAATNDAWFELERDNTERLESSAAADLCARWAAYYINFTNRPEWTANAVTAAMVCEKIQQGVNHRFAKDIVWIQHCDLLRELIGNPFHPTVIARSCLTPKVTQLAQVIYD